jgi:hypothetical protein
MLDGAHEPLPLRGGKGISPATYWIDSSRYAGSPFIVRAIVFMPCPSAYMPKIERTTWASAALTRYSVCDLTGWSLPPCA